MYSLIYTMNSRNVIITRYFSGLSSKRKHSFYGILKHNLHKVCVSQYIENTQGTNLYTCSPLNKSKLCLEVWPTSGLYTRHFSTSSIKYKQEMISQTAIASNLQLSFNEFPTIQGAEKCLQILHDITGLPWWSNIILTAFIMRVVIMVPVTIHTHQNQSRLQRLAPEVQAKSQALKHEVGRAMVQFGWDKERAKKEYDKNLSGMLREMYIRDNCHPAKGIATFWVQVPVFISLSYALRNIVARATNADLEKHMSFKSLASDGLLWFPDLTLTDATWILPLSVGLVTLFNTEMAYLNLPTVTTYRKWLTIGLRGLVLIVVPISSTVPTAVLLYWISSGFFAALQNLLFDYSAFRRLCRLPETPFESNAPLTNLIKKAQKRYFSKEN